jgi:glycogen operon protein
MAKKKKWLLEAGDRFPQGATARPGGVNFSVFSRRATRVWLRLYRGATDPKPLVEIELDPRVHRTYAWWHVFVGGAQAGLYYTWRADGPTDPAAGLRFDPRRELLDPWARLVSDALWRRADAVRGVGHGAVRAQIAAPDEYDWEGDVPLKRSFNDTIVYEMHVGGFTRHPSSGVQAPGTYRGVIEKIPHLSALGVTDVELLPVFAFDSQDVPAAGAAQGLTNFWGYATLGFFAPHPHYAATEDARREFRDMVKALHKTGIGVILDVVLNHTAEGGAEGPVIGFKGLVNEQFYLLDPEDRSRYLDFTGVGNTVRCNDPLVAQFFLECLTFWVREMHVDGFRFDLASVLARGLDGEPTAEPPVVATIEFAEALADTRLIAEAWDATGYYQVGNWPGFRWAEWNGRYRDTLRRFLRSEGGHLGEVATRIAGSSDLYALAGKGPGNSVNFVTCHDGFTLWDLVSYDAKHNEANAEENRDGRDDNFSWNSGLEGATDDPAVLRLRAQRARNALALLMLSQGVPMLLAGDEVLRSQDGNNNAYCQDNDISWLDWSFSPGARQMLRFTRELIAVRKRHPSLRRARFFDPDDGEIHWYGEKLEPPNWQDPEARVLCFTLVGLTPDEPALHVMINMAPTMRVLPLPSALPREWRRVVDTTLAAPDDVSPNGVPVRRAQYRLPGHGLAIFEAR